LLRAPVIQWKLQSIELLSVRLAYFAKQQEQLIAQQKREYRKMATAIVKGYPLISIELALIFSKPHLIGHIARRTSFLKRNLEIAAILAFSIGR